MERRAFTFLSFFLLVAFFNLLVADAEADWTNLGLYGGQIYEIAIDPDDPTRMFAGAYYGDGLYRTLDGGTTWAPVLTGEEGGLLEGEATFKNTAVWSVKIAPSSDANPDNNTLWAVHNYWAEKSTSGGDDASWTHISNAAMQDDCTNCPNDSTPTQAGSEQFRYCHALAIDPQDPQTVYVGTGGPSSSDEKGAIYKTTDGGSTWTKLGLIYPGFDPDTAFQDDPEVSYEPRDLENEFYSKVVAIAVHPTDSNIVWAVDFNDVLGKYLCILYMSDDGGLSWNHRVGLGAYMGESGLVIKPDEPNVVFMGTFWGIVGIAFEADTAGDLHRDSTANLAFPIGWGSGRNIRALAFDPQNASTLYASAGLTSNFKLLKSVDGGENFPHEYSHDQQYIHLAPHPLNSSIIFGGDRLLGIFRGDYAGGSYTWTKKSDGIQAIRTNDIAIDPNDSSHYLVATMAGVFEQQGGQSNPWSDTAPLDYTEAFSVAFDAGDTDGSSFLAGGESILYKTTDHGQTWSKSNSLGYPHFVNDVTIDPADSQNVFVTTRYPGKVFKSTDGGTSLTKVLDSSGAYDFGAVTIDPNDSTHIYAGGGNFFGTDASGDLYESTTGGGSGTWSPILPAVTVNALLIDPDNPNLVYAGCGYSGGTEVPLYRSTDGGTTWHESYAGMPGEPLRRGLWGSASNDLFVLKHTGSVAKGGLDDENILHFDGGDWGNMDIGASLPLYGVWGSGGADVFVVGEAGTILHYDGNAWAAMDSGTGMDLSGVAGSAPGNVYAVGKGGLILHYTGAVWSMLDSGVYKDLNAVWSTSDGSSVFAVGAYGTVVHSGDGTSWAKQTTGTASALRGVWGASAANVVAVGDGGTILSYDGSTWTAASSGTSKNLTAVWGTGDGTQAYAVGENGTILHYSGGTWSPMTSGTDADLHAVWGTAWNQVYAVGQYGTLLDYDGSSWSEVDVGFKEFPAWNSVTDLKFKLEGSDRIIYASTVRQGIYASSDGGNSWTNMSTPPYEVYALATGSVIVGTQGGVLAMSGYGLLYGQVTDHLGTPIPNVTIATDIGKSTVSASDGTWSIGMKAGTYVVTATVPGYGRVSETDVPIYDATGTFVGFEFNNRSIYVSIGNREVLGTAGSFVGPGGRVTPTAGQFTWSQGSGDGELSAQYGVNTTLVVEPDPGQRAVVVVDGQSHGSDTISFTPLTGSHAIETVFDNQAPAIIGQIDDQTKAEDADSWELDLTPYESDLEDSGTNLNWSVSGVNTSLFTVEVIDAAGDLIEFQPVPNAHGSDDILLTLTDAGGLTDSQTITVTLTPVNDAPVVGDIPDQTIAEGNTFATIHLDNFVSDVDNTDAEMTWSTSGQT
ncbi:MAG: carboxypeptidase regulatory-like domain-containing protein, partial [Deltaproteobacteria bacterium]|nr:carboxypeptidase regulatory-like domain-containing protein [Deltaproteobacteria bacterium]